MALRRLQLCVRRASEVEERDTVMPTSRPMTTSLVKRRGRRRRSQMLEVGRRSQTLIVTSFSCRPAWRWRSLEAGYA